jgi:hypothetical protein
MVKFMRYRFTREYCEKMLKRRLHGALNGRRRDKSIWAKQEQTLAGSCRQGPGHHAYKANVRLLVPILPPFSHRSCWNPMRIIPYGRSEAADILMILFSWKQTTNPRHTHNSKIRGTGTVKFTNMILDHLKISVLWTQTSPIPGPDQIVAALEIKFEGAAKLNEVSLSGFRYLFNTVIFRGFWSTHSYALLVVVLPVIQIAVFGLVRL